MPDVVVTPARFIAYVALSAAARVAGPAVAARLSEGFPDWAGTAQAIEVPGAGDVQAGFLLSIGERTLVVSFVDAPLPPDCFRDDAHQRIWPSWAEAARTQCAHVIVATLETATDTPSAVQGAALVIATAAVLSELTPAVGVNWAENRLFVAPEVWRRAAAAMRPDQLPMAELIRPLWYAGAVGGNQVPGLVTLGLAPFVGREVEHPPTGESPNVVYERTLNLCLYLMRSGPVLRDGDTVGQTPEQRIMVRVAERDGVPVWRLVFERPATAVLAARA